MALLTFTDKGIYCEQGGFYIDPHKVVDKAIVTHAHSDHAIRGHRNYLAHRFSVPILKSRLGQRINTQGVEYGEILDINGVKVTLIPSGHIIGAAQVRLEYKGEVWVVTGDYKIEDDGLSGKFEPIKCNFLISETTFGMPIFKWRDQKLVFKEMSEWWRQNQQNLRPSVLLCYSLGKAQRIMNGIDKLGEIFVSEDIARMDVAIKQNGIKLPNVKLFDPSIDINSLKTSLILTSRGSSKAIIPYLSNPLVADVSGWVAVNPFSGGFVLSDHADWNGLNYAVRESNAEKVFLTHGYTNYYANWLNKKGIEASVIEC